MMFLFFMLSLVVVNILGEDIYNEAKISYDNLKNLNVSCYPKDSCENRKTDDYPGINFPNSCSCHTQCSQLGTCCIDSVYRGSSPQLQKCRTVDFPTIPSRAYGYYMVHRCPNNINKNTMWKNLCEDEWNNEDDILKIAPVISFNTNTTYKNYYCLRCHETSDNFLYWNLHLSGHHTNSEEESKNNHFTVKYIENSWFATIDERNVSIPVSLQFIVPEGQPFPTVQCEPQIIDHCSESWTDDSVRRKCNSYSAVVYRYRSGYKNVHCAYCNFQPLTDFSCKKPVFPVLKKVFSFTHLMDINTSDGDKVGKVEKCQNNGIWDPFGKKCRKPSCALPGYIIKDGQCTKE